MHGIKTAHKCAVRQNIHSVGLHKWKGVPRLWGYVDTGHIPASAGVADRRATLTTEQVKQPHSELSGRKPSPAEGGDGGGRRRGPLRDSAEFSIGTSARRNPNTCAHASR